MKQWEIIADRYGQRAGHTASPSILPSTDFFFCVDAHRDGKRFIVKADDLLTAFVSLEIDAIALKGANGNATRHKVA